MDNNIMEKDLPVCETEKALTEIDKKQYTTAEKVGQLFAKVCEANMTGTEEYPEMMPTLFPRWLDVSIYWRDRNGDDDEGGRAGHLYYHFGYDNKDQETLDKEYERAMRAIEYVRRVRAGDERMD